MPELTSRPAAPTRAERLERLSFNREHGRLLVGSGIGWALDAMDVGLISFVMAALATQWQLSLHQTSWIGSIGFVGMALVARSSPPPCWSTASPPAPRHWRAVSRC